MTPPDDANNDAAPHLEAADGAIEGDARENSFYDYEDFALSNDTSTFDPNHPVNLQAIENGLGFAPQVVHVGEGYVTVAANSCQTLLHVPMGWHGVDNGQRTLFYTPDEQVQMTMNFVQIEPTGSPETMFRDFINNLLSNYHSQLADNPGTSIEDIEMPEGSVAICISDIASEDGLRSLLQVLTPNPAQPEFPLSINLSTPAEQMETLMNLVILILRDRQVQWGSSGNESTAEVAMATEAAPFREAAHAVVQTLAANDAEGFIAQLSPNFVEAVGLQPIRDNLENEALPFFTDFEQLSNSATVTQTHDGFGNDGFAFYLSFIDSQGEEKPFILYMIEENSRIVVGNLLINKTYADMH